MASKNELNNTKMLQSILDTVVEIKNGVYDNKKEILSVKENVKRLHDSHLYLEDDTPTIKDYKNLEKRVKKLETKLASI